MAYHQDIGGTRHSFADLKDLLAKASPARSGDHLAGLAADSAEQRVAARLALAEQARFLQFAAGAVSGPLDAWLTTRGIKTLGVRMQRHSENGDAVARFLDAHPGVARVYYPGLASHPGHEIAAAQMSGFGGIVSLALGDAAAARRFAESTRLFTLAESLGGVESLLNYPDEMTHASVRGTALAVPVDLVRLSVGIEDVEDQLEDLERALAGAS